MMKEEDRKGDVVKAEEEDEGPDVEKETRE